MHSPTMNALLLRRASGPLARKLEAIEDLESTELESYERGRTAWPVEVSREAWAEHLLRHLGEQPEAHLRSLHPDFYLAVALRGRDPAALGLFQKVLSPRVRATIARRAPTSVIIDEVLSAVEDRLFFAAPEGCISDYAGRGSLDRYVRAAAVHQLMNKLRTPQSESLTDLLTGAMIDTGATPEWASMASDTRNVFLKALSEAFRALPDRDRLLLRLHTFENATIVDIGRMYQVHKVTAFRWLEEARARLRTGTLSKLTEKLPRTEVESFLRAVPRSIDLSLKSIFRSLESAPAAASLS